MRQIQVFGACEHNLKQVDVQIERQAITVVTGVSGSGKSSLAFDTVLSEAQRRFFYTLSHYSRQFLDMGARPAVKSMSGLSPAISLSQNETQPSRRASVGTLTDIAELLGVIFARFGSASCPKHGLPTTAQTVEQMADGLLSRHAGETLALLAPFAEGKKGHFATQLTQFHAKGFSRAYIDGKIVSLQPVPTLAKEEKHTIKIIVDYVKIKRETRDRLLRSLTTALQLTDGFVEVCEANDKGQIDLKSLRSLSSQGGCATCGFSWPKLDSRYFSANSLGRCQVCNGYGVEGIDEEVEDESELVDVPCPACRGVGIRADVAAIQLQGKSVHDCHRMSIDELFAFLTAVARDGLAHNAAFLRVWHEMEPTLKRMLQLGLGYLSLNRRVRSLSGGEAQRLRLSMVLGEHLRGVMYVLDEPSQGLHPSELAKIWTAIEQLKKDGNTVIIVDHDEMFIRESDWIIDLGPGGGAQGGHLLGRFRPSEAKAYEKQSLTARYLLTKHGAGDFRKAQSFSDWISLVGCRLHNLKNVSVRIPKGAFTVVTGVSGAGKTSLAMKTVYANALAAIAGESKAKYCQKASGLDSFKFVTLIDRRPVAKSSVSMPATYLDVFTDMRTLYEDLPEAQMAGLTARSFSLNAEGGRCETCKGRGEMNLSMRFLADARVRCEVCKGRRYRPDVLEVRFSGLSLDQVLELTIDEAIEHFKNFRKIVKKLVPAQKLGLGYLKLGQPSASLSGGEAQRLKMVPFLVKARSADDLIIVDEPTTGLHFEDVKKLLASLRDMVDAQATVIIVEHNLDVIRAADWMIDLGPGSAESGGHVLYEGPPSGITAIKESPTGQYLH